MGARYMSMSKYMFENMLSSYFFWMPAPQWRYHYEWQLDGERKWELIGREKEVNEYIYLILLTNGHIIAVYSSIFKGTNHFRNTGHDRVHLHFVNAKDLTPLGGPHPKLNRVSSRRNPFPKRFRSAVEKMLTDINYFSPKKCSGCEGNFILRKGANSRYIFGCENYQRKRGPHDHPVSMKGKMVQPIDVGRGMK
jgi:hypothetical protein